MKNRNKKSIQEMILSFLSGKRAVSEEKLLEEILMLSEKEGIYKNIKTKPQYLIKKTLKKMLDDEHIGMYQTTQSIFFSITPKGKIKLKNIILSSRDKIRLRNWDGLWRVVIMDISDTRKREKDAVRYLLQKAHFVQIRQSLWISPFPMESFIEDMKRDMGLDREIILLISKGGDQYTEEALKERFIEKQ